MSDSDARGKVSSHDKGFGNRPDTDLSKTPAHSAASHPSVALRNRRESDCAQRAGRAMVASRRSEQRVGNRVDIEAWMGALRRSTKVLRMRKGSCKGCSVRSPPQFMATLFRIYLTDLYQGLLYPSSNDLTYGLLHISVSIHYSNKGPLYEVAQMDGEKLPFIVAGSDWKFIEPSCFHIRRWHPSNLYYRLRKIHTSHLLRQRR